MTHPVVFRPQAAAETRDALQWYEEQKPGLGARFAAAVEQTVQRIAANPAAFPSVHGEIRRAVVQQFPYGIYFNVHDGEIVVLAILHGRRHPERWRSR